jgi:hypothetical protein
VTLLGLQMLVLIARPFNKLLNPLRSGISVICLGSQRPDKLRDIGPNSPPTTGHRRKRISVIELNESSLWTTCER